GVGDVGSIEPGKKPTIAGAGERPAVALEAVRVVTDEREIERRHRDSGKSAASVIRDGDAARGRAAGGARVERFTSAAFSIGRKAEIEDLSLRLVERVARGRAVR